MGEDHVHEPPPEAGRAGGIPRHHDSILRAPLRGEAGDNPWCLEVSGVQLCYRLAAPTSKRPHSQPRCAHSTPHVECGVAHGHFHGSWCPAGHDNSAKNSAALFIRSGDYRFMSYWWRIHNTPILSSRSVAYIQGFRAVLGNSPPISMSYLGVSPPRLRSGSTPERRPLSKPPRSRNTGQTRLQTRRDLSSYAEIGGIPSPG
jgi:hypothetical protein